MKRVYEEKGLITQIHTLFLIQVKFLVTIIIIKKTSLLINSFTKLHKLFDFQFRLRKESEEDDDGFRMTLNVIITVIFKNQEKGFNKKIRDSETTFIFRLLSYLNDGTGRKENTIEGNHSDFSDYLFLNYNTQNALLDEIVSNTIHDSIREKILFLSFVKCLSRKNFPSFPVPSIC